MKGGGYLKMPEGVKRRDVLKSREQDPCGNFKIN